MLHHFERNGNEYWIMSEKQKLASWPRHLINLLDSDECIFTASVTEMTYDVLSRALTWFVSVV